MRQSRHDALKPWSIAAAGIAGAGMIALARSASRRQASASETTRIGGSAEERDINSVAQSQDPLGIIAWPESSTVRRALLASVGLGVGMLVASYAVRGRRYTGIKIKKSIIINRSATELYGFWRNFENLADASEILQSVEMINDVRSRWTVSGPGNIPVQWDAEITKDIPDEMIGWRSVEGAPIETAGYVRFEPTPGNRGTMVRVALEYNPLASRIGAALNASLGRNPETHIDRFLRRLKQLTEAGEAAISRIPSRPIAS